MRGLLVVAAICVAACAPAGPQELQILSKGSPPVTIVINDVEVARLVCNEGAVLRPRVAGTPPLPWDLRVVDQRAGRTMLNERVSELPRWVVVFRDSAGISRSAILGPLVPCDAAIGALVAPR
jgi:hypothetical protein